MSRHVLVLNAGSSSIKYRLIDVDDNTPSAQGLIERIGEPSGSIHHRGPAGEVQTDRDFPDHEHALRAALSAFEQAGPSLNQTELIAVGHRVVHGGDTFSQPVVIDDDVVDAIEGLVPLAPLHNPANLRGITVARRVFADVPQVAVFDTAFHQSLPPHAYTYAVPQKWRTQYDVRRYGFHGISHDLVSRTAAETLGRDPRTTNLIVLHLGNGASATAVAGGRSVDTSMGLTPLQGLVMGTRSGDIDPAIIAHLQRSAGWSITAIDNALNHSSGLLGLSGHNDLREVHRLADSGDDDATLALDVYCYRIRTYVGAYYAALGHLDAVVFTAGVGENDARVRARSLAGLEELGIEIDDDRNGEDADHARIISPDTARVATLVVPTDEELEIATQAVAVLA